MSIHEFTNTAARESIYLHTHKIVWTATNEQVLPASVNFVSDSIHLGLSDTFTVVALVSIRVCTGNVIEDLND